MIVINDIYFRNFDAWGYGETVKERIMDAGKDEEFDEVISELYPDGIDATKLNDILSFDHEWVYSTLGMADDDEIVNSRRIRSDFFKTGEECIVEVNEGGKWEPVSLAANEQGWDLKGRAKVFKSEADAKGSTLVKRLKNAGYSEESGNLRFSLS